MAGRRKRVVTFRGAPAGPEHVGLLDVEASIQAGRGVRARLGRCYNNAMRAAPCFDDVLYVEGYAVLRGVPIEHAWLLADGAVIDPTAAAFEDGVMFDSYVPVLVWTLDGMARQALEQGVVPLGDWFAVGWEIGTMKPEDVAGAWQTTALRLAGYSGAATDFFKERGL